MTSRMTTETKEIPACVARQRSELADDFERAGRALATLNPPVVATLARGSSDHAAIYLKYLVELATGTPVASLPPSVASVWRRPLRLRGAACVAISQSGRSPDLLDALDAANRSGASCFAMVNDPLAPMISHAIALPIGAGPETSVAATKSFAGSLTAITATAAAWHDPGGLRTGLDSLAPLLDDALDRDWSEPLDALARATSVYTIGRGPGLAVAAEAALKLKETCRVHAEAYSAAEVLHGPVELGSPSMVVVAFASVDEGRDSVMLAARRLAGTGARVFVADPLNEPPSNVGGGTPLAMLEVVRTDHPWLDPVSQIASFYRLVEAFARRRGLDPDAPRELAKVTETR